MFTFRAGSGALPREGHAETTWYGAYLRSSLSSQQPQPRCPLITLSLMTTIANNPLAGPSALRDIIRPQFHQNNFAEESYIKSELGIKLDKGAL